MCVPIRRSVDTDGLMYPIQSGPRRALGTEIHPDGVGFLLTALQLEEIVPLGGKQLQTNLPAADLDSLGELLPELRNGDGQAAAITYYSDGGIGPKAMLFLRRAPSTIAAEGAGYTPFAINVITALPILPAAGILVNLQVWRGEREGVARFTSPCHLWLFPALNAQIHRQTTEEDRVGVSQIPEPASMTRPAGVVDGQTQAHEAGPAEEAEPRYEPARQTTGENSFVTDGDPVGALRLNNRLFHARLDVTPFCASEDDVGKTRIQNFFTPYQYLHKRQDARSTQPKSRGAGVDFYLRS